ncbi:GAF domain-containing protein [Dyadobacter sp. CY323]|uniref:GAF domain-containing protein n=1 Tax=Dyadobacter sp. CY323 TaxID=2907302 RepID=UPI001F184420|nr:GAF domain-containing protein [Dyadobacter sp. CY323]
MNLLIVAIRPEWLILLENSLTYAGYTFQMKQADSKQAAIKAFHEGRYDLLISNCALPDGTITDLADVLGSQLPCLVMSEGFCPVSAGPVLAVTDTNYYINCTNKLEWIPALENTLIKWKNNAQQKLDQHQQRSETFNKKVMARCEEIFSSDKGHDGSAEAVDSAFELLLEVMDLSRIYLCMPHNGNDGETEIRKRVEVTAPGVALKRSASANPLEIPFFTRWNILFESGRPVQELLENLPRNEHHWLARHDIMSLLAVPVCENGRWLAYIGLEDTMNIREWSEAEIELVVLISGLIHKKYLSNEKSSRLNPELLTSPA